jgi:hydrogenase nickel incorporation protein HypA/HybF
MHEWALAEGIIATANKYAEKELLDEITEVNIAIGELQQIEHEIIQFALDQLKTHKMKNAKFVINKVPARFKCRKCSREWSFESKELSEETSEAVHFVPEMAHVYIKCPNCGSPDFEITQGRGVWLASIKGKRNE